MNFVASEADAKFGKVDRSEYTGQNLSMDMGDFKTGGDLVQV